MALIKLLLGLSEAAVMVVLWILGIIAWILVALLRAFVSLKDVTRRWR